MTRQTEHDQLSRRDALRLAAGAGAAALLAACGGGGASTTSSATTAATGATNAPTTSGASGSTPPPSAAEFVIPASGAKLPTDKVNFHWVDSGDVKAFFWNAYFPAYQKAHANIAVQYDALPWTEINKLVPLGVQNGNAPDVFQIPQGLTGGQVVQQGWVLPLDDLIPDFANWKTNFPPGSFVEGLTTFKGKTYTLPFTTNKRYATLLLYNADYLKQAGVDPQAKPMTWDEYRAAAKKLTQQGAGKYYGVIIEGAQTQRWGDIVRSLATVAGAMASGVAGPVQDMNLKTGEYAFASDQYLGAIDLLLGLKADGSVFPGSLNLNAPQARAQMPQGVAAMMLQGVWNIPQWLHDNPAFNFDVAPTPVPNSGAPMPQGYGPGGSNQMWVYAKSKYAAIAGDIFHYLGTDEGQTKWATITGGSDPPIFPKANEKAQLDPRARKTLGFFDQQMRLAPSPNVRNPDVALINLELKPLTPDFGTTVQGIYTGQVADPKKAMQDLKDRADKELDRAIKAAQAKGAKVTRDDFAFANWDPTKDYTDADYAALKK
jgi:multiple sugar transport system substrate-binding protein